MIQFNLLPDVKFEYVKTQRTKRLIFLSAAGITGASLALFIIMLVTVQVVQKQHIKNIDKEITDNSNTLKNAKELDKVLTIQNQLNALVDLHEGKHFTSKIYEFLNQVTPVNCNLNKVSINFASNILTLDGTVNKSVQDKAASVNKFADTLKFTKFTTKDSKEPKDAFQSVVVSQFTYGDTAVSYGFTITFDPALFNIKNVATLDVPQNLITTRSYTEQPKTELFNGASKEKDDKTGSSQ